MGQLPFWRIAYRCLSPCPSADERLCLGGEDSRSGGGKGIEVYRGVMNKEKISVFGFFRVIQTDQNYICVPRRLAYGSCGAWAGETSTIGRPGTELSGVSPFEVGD